MKAVAVKCPECGARLEAPAGQTEVKCTYCGTLAVIQRRTRFLQRVERLPERPADKAALPVATEARSSRSAVVAVLIPITLIVGVTLGVPLVISHVANQPVPEGAFLLADLNGDGLLDIIADVKERESSARYVAAYSGKNGKPIWRSPELRRGGARGAFCLANDVVLVGDSGVHLWGIGTADGGLRFKRRMDEAVKTLCEGSSPGTARVITADGKRYNLALSNDAAKASPGGGCRPLACADYGRTPGVEKANLRHWSGRGMRADYSLRHIRSGTTIALGHKFPGTSVPMIALIGRVEGQPATGDTMAIPTAEVATWQATVPATDPLSAKSGAPSASYVALDAEQVAVAYNAGNYRHRLTVFSVADGKRRFDVALPKAMHAIWSVKLSKKLVVVSSAYRVIAAHDRKSGSQLFVVD